MPTIYEEIIALPPAQRGRKKAEHFARFLDHVVIRSGPYRLVTGPATVDAFGALDVREVVLTVNGRRLPVDTHQRIVNPPIIGSDRVSVGDPQMMFLEIIKEQAQS